MRVRGEAAAVPPTAWVDELTTQFAQRLQERAHAWELLDLPAPPVAELLDRVAALIPPAAPNSLDTDLGPFYDTAGVKALLGVTKQAVEDRRRKHTILAARTSDGRWAYPTFQFFGTGVDPTFAPVVAALRGAPDWAAAAWCVTANPDLGGMTPLAWTQAGHAPDDAVASARRTVTEWR